MALLLKAKLKERFAKENIMADTKKDFLKGYASGIEKQKLRNKLEGTKANKPLLDEEKVTAFRDKLRNPGKYAGADFSPDPYSSGTIKGASDMATAIEKEKEYKDVMDMVAKDKKFVDKKKAAWLNLQLLNVLMVSL